MKSEINQSIRRDLLNFVILWFIQSQMISDNGERMDRVEKSEQQTVNRKEVGEDVH